MKTYILHNLTLINMIVKKFQYLSLGRILYNTFTSIQ